MKFSQPGTLPSSILLSASLVAATPQPSKCNRDNCLRNLVDARYSSSASAFCSTYTTAVVTEPSAIPSYLAGCSSLPSRVSSACACVVTPTPPKWVSSEALQQGITSEGLMANLDALDKIATANGGNRAFGFPGYAASVDYILSKTQTSKSWTLKTQDFPGLFNKVESISFIVSDVDYYIYGLTYSPSTSAEGLTAPIVLGASGDIGCTVEGYVNLDVKDKIVLVQRGRCPDGTTLAGRMKPAAAAGAAAVIIYSNNISNVTAGTLSAPNPDYVPSGYINQADGLALKARLDAGETIEAYFQQTQTVETRITQNIIAESNEGDPENVIMLGAHLDSVQAGAGINDDGSGTTLILEVFEALQKFKFKNKIRFAWWGAEENGLVGSRYYTSTLPSSDIDSLLLYLNFDMVSRGYFGVFDGDGSSHNLTGPAGSDVIEKLFVDDLTSKGITVTPAVFTGGSDYASFMSVLEKPVGGLHTGTGIEQDDCYHQACDTYKNANATVLTVNAKTAAHVLSILAMEGEKLIPKTPSNSTGSVMRRASYTGSVIRDSPFFPWTVLEEERHVGSCGHDI